MSYASGQTINSAEYNTFVQGGAAVNHAVANVNTIWGAGTGAKGYGQSGTLAATSVGSTISATQWADLVNRISTIATHQGTTLTAVAAPTAGTTISAIAAMQANVDAVFANTSNAAAQGAAITDTATITGEWTTSTILTHTATFTDGESLQSFFNAGGTIAINTARSGGTVNNKNTEWTDLCTQAGTIVYSLGIDTATIAGVAYTGTNKIGGAGTATIAAATGIADITASNVSIFKQFADTAPYTANYIEIFVKSTASNNVVFEVQFVDAAADEAFNATLDIVGGTLTSQCDLRQPSTTSIANSWGTPTNVNATVSQA